MTSIVRLNLLKHPGYSPYCGSEKCSHMWPRTTFNGQQFECRCGWSSTFEPEFIEQVKLRRAEKSERPTTQENM